MAMSGPPLSSVARPANHAPGGCVEGAVLRNSVTAIPAPTWFTLRAHAMDQLRVSMQRVLAGSAWREPDEVLRDCAIVREGLHETAKLIVMALGRLDAHARRAGLGGIDRSATTAPMPTPQPVPNLPRTHRLVDIAVFGRQCVSLLDPATLHPGIDQLERARVGMANVAMRQHGSLHWQAQELNVVAGLLGQAKQALSGALERLTSCHSGLQRYLIGAIGTPRITQRPHRNPHRRARSVRVGRQVRAAKDAARTATEKADRASAATRRIERRNAKQAKQRTKQEQ